ncbi:MAG: hypothetical protein ABSB74_13310 [Tepidisphaeraceae bacterium]
MRFRKLGLMVVAGGLAWGCISSAYGSSVPITYETQDRSVSANSTASGFSRGGTNTAPITDQQSQSQQANGMGVFNGNAGVTSTLGPGSPLATASAVQQSSLNVNQIDAGGYVRADSNLGTGIGPAISSATTALHITFDAAQSQAYAFTANLNGSTDLALPGNTSAAIQLTDASGNNLFAPITTVNLVNFQTQGTLAAGVYKLTLDAQAISNDQSANFVNYSLSLTTSGNSPTLSNGVGNPPSTARAVPLPPAAPITLLMLASMGIAGYLRSRFRQRAGHSIS